MSDTMTRREALTALLERAVDLFKMSRVAHHNQAACRGEIPCAQINILSEMDAQAFRLFLNHKMKALIEQETGE